MKYKSQINLFHYKTVDLTIRIVYRIVLEFVIQLENCQMGQNEQVKQSAVLM